MTEKTNDEVMKEQGTAIVESLVNRTSKETATLIKNAIENGEADPAYVGVVLKKFAKVQEIIKKDTVQEVIDSETKKYQVGTTKTFPLYGAKVTLANTGYWDYGLTEDPYLEKLQAIEKQMKEMIKARKEQIQSQAAVHDSKNSPLNVQQFGLKPFTITWDDMPELTWVEGYGESDTNPPVKKGKETLRYTL